MTKEEKELHRKARQYIADGTVRDVLERSNIPNEVVDKIMDRIRR